MAQMARLRLLDRWRDWARTPFGPEDKRHISIYGGGV